MGNWGMERSGICPKIFCEKGSQRSQQKTSLWMVFRILPCECRNRLKESTKQPAANGVAGHKAQTFTTYWKRPCLNWHQHKSVTAQKNPNRRHLNMGRAAPLFFRKMTPQSSSCHSMRNIWHGNSRRQNVSQENRATFSPGGHRANRCKIKCNW